jgi:hypothetical protein
MLETDTETHAGLQVKCPFQEDIRREKSWQEEEEKYGGGEDDGEGGGREGE